MIDSRCLQLSRAWRLESSEIRITEERISRVPSQSGSAKLTPSSSTDKNALLSGSAQLRMLASAANHLRALPDRG